MVGYEPQRKPSHQKIVASGSFETVEKELPPVGVMPEWLWKEKRVHELVDAIARYTIANRYDCADNIASWLNELHRLVYDLKVLRGGNETPPTE